jgi:hypothetical protein
MSMPTPPDAPVTEPVQVKDAHEAAFIPRALEPDPPVTFPITDSTQEAWFTVIACEDELDPPVAFPVIVTVAPVVILTPVALALLPPVIFPTIDTVGVPVAILKQVVDPDTTFAFIALFVDTLNDPPATAVVPDAVEIFRHVMS